MTPRERWAVAWRTVRVSCVPTVVGRPEYARLGSGNTTGRSGRRRFPLRLDRPKGWLLAMAAGGGVPMHGNRGVFTLRENYLEMYHDDLGRSIRDREHWERLP